MKTEAAGLDLPVRRDLLHSLFMQAPATAIGASSMCLLMAYAAWQHVPDFIIGCFLLITLGVQAFRLATGLIFRRRPATPLDPRFWGAVATATASASGLSVALGCVLLHLYGGEPLLVFIFMMLTGLNAGGVGNNSYHPPALRAFVFLSTPVFMVYMLIFIESPNLTILAIALAVHAFITLMVIGRDHMRTLRSSVLLRHEKNDLLEQLQQQTAAAEAARAHAEAANEEKTRFFASASHDLRQPVHALNLYTTLLRDASDEDRGELLERVGRCVNTLDDLFNALLTVSRAEATGRDTVRQHAVSLDAAIDSVLTQLEPQARKKGLALRRAPTSLWVRGDAIAVERILGNLVSNAIRFTANGTVLVGVRRRGGSAELQVLDTGIGLADAQRARIFEEFYQVANPGRDAAQGFGLGLVIVQRLCQSFGYEVSVHSVAGRGTRLSVAMPQLPAPTESEEPAVHADTEGFSASHISTLMVDDDPMIRDAMQRVFADWGMSAQIVAGGEQALEAAVCMSASCGCLLLDLRLGEALNGVQLAQQLLDVLGHRIPVAILTGEAEGPLLDEARALGYTVLRKPVKIMRLRAFLTAAAAQAPRRAELS
ncbi:ATP-binding response regulator [Nevskia ramosa]|uniref:ATP-binding response regulator n=1 Tax=Nevskia ramosa TaxID=64002 RepID=UPI0023525773|nr:hybrid sensor histidine kinase/response regulator [Nevskia ramosa]